MKTFFRILLLIFVLPTMVVSQTGNNTSNQVREHLLLDEGWRFSLGHAADFAKDFYTGTSAFTWFAKAGYGDGPAAANFEDRIWRLVDLPHDWAVELPFSPDASHSHGYKTIGWKYPENSIGWYRKTIFIPVSDLGRKISVQFDGIHRNSMVWVNGFYLGTEHSGYTGFEYDISDYLNYGGNNVIAVRADASIEEGWYYEGAGIYRHCWLNKTSKLHVKSNGTFATTEFGTKSARLTVRTTIVNQLGTTTAFTIEQSLFDAQGRKVSYNSSASNSLEPMSEKTCFSGLYVENPTRWDLQNPYLYKLVTTISSGGKITDVYETNIGLRTVTFDANSGFFLNGKNIKLKGGNMHQDHAGVGTAIPDGLQEFRVRKLMEMGNNAIRTSHNPPTPELLDICDRLGVLVLAENRLMGINSEHYDLLKRMIERDRNHPCVIAWSLGNEEWAIEGNILGERITRTMQTYAQTLDSSRQFTVAISGGCGNGTSRSLDIMGFNYLVQCDIDDYHSRFPLQPSMGTEESTTQGTRGVYISDKSNGRMAATDRTGEGPTIERGWKFYDERDYLAGLFFWTGFDYRGEPYPLKWPAVGSQFGIIDQCGFPKDPFYYLKSWWTTEPVLYIAPHWNWEATSNPVINVWAYSNCDEVELVLNKKSLGKKKVIKNSHLEWSIAYKPGTLLAKGYKNGRVIITALQETTGAAASVSLSASKSLVNADGEDVSMITVQVTDADGKFVPTADNTVEFKLSGPGRIIGVGNGDPASHEADKYSETVDVISIADLRMKKVRKDDILPELDYASAGIWETPLKQQEQYTLKDTSTTTMNVIRATFVLPEFTEATEIILFPKSLCNDQSVFVNGQLVVSHMQTGAAAPACTLNHSFLKTGENIIVFSGAALQMQNQWDQLNTDPGSIRFANPAKTWKRTLFNGLAQVIVQSLKQSGEIVLTATSNGLKTAVVEIKSVPCSPKPSVEAVKK